MTLISRPVYLPTSTWLRPAQIWRPIISIIRWQYQLPVSFQYDLPTYVSYYLPFPSIISLPPICRSSLVSSSPGFITPVLSRTIFRSCMMVDRKCHQIGPSWMLKPESGVPLAAVEVRMVLSLSQGDFVWVWFLSCGFLDVDWYGLSLYLFILNWIVTSHVRRPAASRTQFVRQITNVFFAFTLLSKIQHCCRFRGVFGGLVTLTPGLSRSSQRIHLCCDEPIYN